MGEVRLESVWVDYRPRRRSRRHHPRVWALKDVSLALYPGERLGVIGGNGSGKTTLLRTISGVFVPTAGRAEFNGRAASVIDLSTGPQRDLSGHENLEIEARLLGLDREELDARYEDILDLAAIPTEALDQPVYTYSNGMLLRLFLGLAIGCEPDLLVIDEVLAVADARFQARFLDRIEVLCRGGTTLVLASHNLEAITRNTDRAVVLDRGEIVLAGPSEQAVARYRQAVAGLESPPAGSGDLTPAEQGPSPDAVGATLSERLARAAVE